jgi:hypothetical protein
MADPSSTGDTRSGVDDAAAGLTLFVGALSTFMASAHLYGVLVTAAKKGYPYDFRFAALLVLGTTIVFAGTLCLSAVRGLVRGHRRAWDRAMIGSLLLLLVTVLVYPVQEQLAGGLAFVAALDIVLLVASRLEVIKRQGQP